MAGSGSVAAIVLAVVLFWAATVKVRRREATAIAFGTLGLPVPRFLAVAVPVTEVGVAVTLAVRPSIGAAAAIALLATFTALLVRALATHAEVGCGCFGAPGDHPVSPADVVRNGLLIGLAVLATGAPRLASPNASAVAGVVGACLLGWAGVVHGARRWRWR